ncbi:uncharacterized protein LOC130718897 isoform X5 [Lotus japonicus]|uniref:uncharacterized protein LOC130718897 isoform X5 n=1 Tax=Lotus japonicus TaxID=34305 RepID=UPI00258DA35F|nr:uncharacterized protein LOC130718897 isoform X5 [Lotus japonicus]
MLVCVYVESCFAVAVCSCWENYYLIVSVWHWFSSDEVCSVTATQEVSPQLFLLSASSVRCKKCKNMVHKLHYHIYGSELKCFFRLKCGFELSFNICSLHYISKFSPRVMLHYEKRKVLIPEMKTQQTPAIYPPMLASGLFKQGNPVEKVTLNLLQRQVSSRHCHERKEKGCF